MIYRIFTSLLFFLPSLLISQTVSGTIKDAKTQKPLGYASIQVAGTLSGTVANDRGEFTLTVPEGSDTIVFAFLGYQNSTYAILDAREQEVDILLSPVEFKLQEIIVRPLSPQDYIREAVAAYPENFSSTPFSTVGYFSEKSALRNEKGKSYRNTESIFTSYFPNYMDTTQESQSVLNLYRRDSSEVFYTILEDNKRIKKMNEEEDGSNFDMDTPAGQGPSMVLDAIQGALDLPFLKEKNFKRINFTFGANTAYLGKSLIVINFETKRRVDRSHYQGKVYIDNASMAFVSIEFSQQFRMPFYINPLLRTVVGFRIKDIALNAKIHNQELNGTWYPKDVLGQVQFRFRQSGEDEQWAIRQLLSISDINLNPAGPPEKTRVFSSSKEMNKQLWNPTGLDWNDVNIID